MPGLNLTNLKGADAKGFTAMPAGQYDAIVYEASHTEVGENSTGSLPPGTPGIKLQFKIDGGDYDNRRLFTNLWLAPDGHEKKSVMDNIMAAALVAMGFPEDEVTSGKLKVDYEDFAGREVRLSVGTKTYNGELQNEVKAIKPRSGATAGSALL